MRPILQPIKKFPKRIEKPLPHFQLLGPQQIFWILELNKIRLLDYIYSSTAEKIYNIRIAIQIKKLIYYL